ncbi:MAG: COQ9 family protein [Candidatus Pacebacteria bacterium]|nr:COQ9 family protein [Candidatus Paceibacterota bacterium]
MIAVSDQVSPTPLRDASRQKLLTAILQEVPFTGWNQACLAAAAEAVGHSPAHAERLFPGGVPEVFEYWSHELDAAMVAWLQSPEAQTLRTVARAEAAILWRLQSLTPHREAAKLAMQRMSFPHHRGGTALAMALVGRTVDELWYGLGDRSTDYNWYSKRILLAGVYLPTISYWLSPAAPSLADTEAFLHRQMSRIMSASSFGKRIVTKIISSLSLPAASFKRRDG